MRVSYASATRKPPRTMPDLQEGFRAIEEAPHYAINMQARVLRIGTGRPVKPDANKVVQLAVDGKVIKRRVTALRARTFAAELLETVTLDGEEWRTPARFPDYRVSNLSRVYAVKKAIILAPGINSAGIPGVCLPDPTGLADSFPWVSVRSLVARAFS
ncbi:hypothetical protein ACCT30_12880 [Rhizobium ruizarguesonis]